MEENWPPFFPIIDRDIANEIPTNVQKLQYLAFASWLVLVYQQQFGGLKLMCLYDHPLPSSKVYAWGEEKIL